MIGQYIPGGHWWPKDPKENQKSWDNLQNTSRPYFLKLFWPCGHSLKSKFDLFKVNHKDTKTCYFTVFFLVFNSFITGVSVMKKPVHWFAWQFNGLVSIWQWPQYIPYSEAYSESCQTPKIVNSWKMLTIFAKDSIAGV